MCIINKALHVLTGAPGAGKTAILERLGPDVQTMAEPAREVIAEQRASGGTGTSDQDRALFVELLLARSIEKYRNGTRSPAPAVVFDRGIPDCIAYAEGLGTDPGPCIAAARRYRYSPDVLILPPWEEIYVTDDERTMSFHDTIPFHEALVDAYQGLGYTVLEVPRGTVEERTSFVRAAVSR